MLTTSAQWQAMAASGTAVLRCRLTLVGGGSFEYTDIDAPVISRALMGDGISVGNCVAACLTVTVKTDNSTTENLPRAAGLQLWAWWQAPDETICDAVCLGTFYVAHREYDARTRAMRLTCYDAMLKANAPYTVLNADWPCTMRWLAFAIARALGVVLDPRTTNALDNVPTTLIPEPEEGTTLRDLLSQIAAVHGANWTVTQNTLRLKWIHQQGPADLVEYDPVPEGSDSDVITCRGVVGAVHYDVIPAQALGGSRYQITGLRLILADGTESLAGSDDGIVVPVNVPAWATANQLSWLRAALLNVNYWWPAVLRGAVYDPAAELGDWIEYPVVYTEDGEERTSTGYCMLCAETITLGSLPRADIAMPEPGEAADEYPYLSKAARQSEQVQSRLTQLESVVPTLEGRVGAVEDAVDDLVTGVSGVKGNAESTYRTGNVNLTPANIGAVAKTGDTMTGYLTVNTPWARVILKNGSAANIGLYVGLRSDLGCFQVVQYNNATGKYEDYELPAPDATSDSYYKILTTKNPVTIAQGGTGATTANDARANLGAMRNKAVNVSATDAAVLATNLQNLAFNMSLYETIPVMFYYAGTTTTIFTYGSTYVGTFSKVSTDSYFLTGIVSNNVGEVVVISRSGSSSNFAFRKI